jgi:small subunit ribosomal protein S20
VAHSRSAKKRIRQNEKRRLANRAQKSALKGQVRKFLEAAQQEPAKAADALRATIKKIDQSAAKRVIHRNAAARKKSRLTRRLNKLTAAGRGPAGSSSST